MREMTGAEKGEESDFWRIRHRLPRETRDYVPLVVAAALVGKEPHKYGLENVERWTPVPTETVAVPGGSDLTIVASAVGATGKELRALNPQLIRGMTPPGGSYRVRIPEGRGSLYAANFSPGQGQEPAQGESEADPHRRLPSPPGEERRVALRDCAAAPHQRRRDSAGERSGQADLDPGRADAANSQLEQLQQRASARDCPAHGTHPLRFCHERLRRSAGPMKDPASNSRRPPDATTPCSSVRRTASQTGRLSARLLPLPTEKAT
jgi:membrane-bound lytic murein transglycosylase D